MTIQPQLSQSSGAGRPRRPSRFAWAWFVWMIAMWAIFFVLLAGGRLDGIRDWAHGLPVVGEVVVWVLFLPWMLGTVVWTSSWPEWLRFTLVVLFAVGWTAVSVPRARKSPGRRRF